MDIAALFGRLALAAACLSCPVGLQGATLRTDDGCLMTCGAIPVAPADKAPAAGTDQPSPLRLGPRGPVFGAPLDLPTGGFLTAPDGTAPAWDPPPDPVPAMPAPPR